MTGPPSWLCVSRLNSSQTRRRSTSSPNGRISISQSMASSPTPYVAAVASRRAGPVMAPVSATGAITGPARRDGSPAAQGSVELDLHRDLLAVTHDAGIDGIALLLAGQEEHVPFEVLDRLAVHLDD